MKDYEGSIMKDYVARATLTEAPITQELLNRMTTCARPLHALMGLATEIGELIDMYKKHIFYGKPLDLVNASEELGDICWYLAIEMDVLKIDFDIVQERNIAKLRARYPNKFTEYDAENRDLDNERACSSCNTTYEVEEE